jgi:hypothetical protein
VPLTVLRRIAEVVRAVAVRVREAIVRGLLEVRAAVRELGTGDFNAVLDAAVLGAGVLDGLALCVAAVFDATVFDATDA